VPSVGAELGLPGPGIEIDDEARRVGGQALGGVRWLGRDPLGHRGRAVVGVDEAVDMPAESEPELEVAIDRSG